MLCPSGRFGSSASGRRLDPSSVGFDLLYENYASASPNNANRRSCAERYAAGHFHTKLVWSKLLWSDYAQLRIDIDLTYASLVPSDYDGTTGRVRSRPPSLAWPQTAAAGTPCWARRSSTCAARRTPSPA